MNATWFVTNMAHLSVHLAVMVGVTGLLLTACRVRDPGMRSGLLLTALVSGVWLPIQLAWMAAWFGWPGASTPLPVVAAAYDALDVSLAVGRALPWTSATAGVLAAGAALRAVWLVSGARRMRRGQPASIPVGVLDEVARYQREMRTRAVIEWRSDVHAAATTGLIIPRVFLPETLASEAPDTRRAVVLHELVHVRRGDMAQVLAEELLRTAFWFHPFVRWAVAEVRVAREQLVDAEVVARTGARRPYLEALLKASQGHAVWTGLATTFFGQRQLERRIRHLRGERTMHRWHKVSAAVVVVAAAAGAFAATSTLFPVVRAQAAAGQDSQTKTPPRLVHEVKPVYPEDARAARVEGTVVVDVTVDAGGKVAGTRVVKSVPMLDAATEDALRQWRFEPGRENGQPVTVVVAIETRFGLK